MKKKTDKDIDKKKLLIRCLISKAVNIPPDDIEIVFDSQEIDEVMFQINYNSYIIVIGGFKEIPDVCELKEHIDYLYKSVIEWEEENSGEED